MYNIYTFLTKKASTTMYNLTKINIAFVKAHEHPVNIQDDQSIEQGRVYKKCPFVQILLPMEGTC